MFAEALIVFEKCDLTHTHTHTHIVYIVYGRTTLAGSPSRNKVMYDDYTLVRYSSVVFVSP